MKRLCCHTPPNPVKVEEVTRSGKTSQGEKYSRILRKPQTYRDFVKAQKVFEKEKDES